MYGVIKHFPGHGATAGDTHEGYAYTDKSLEELEQQELVPFQNAIENPYCHYYGRAYFSTECAGDNTPSSLSKIMITDVLREKWDLMEL